jgi:hypothetical protein
MLIGQKRKCAKGAQTVNSTAGLTDPQDTLPTTLVFREQPGGGFRQGFTHHE